jgi:protein-S-isoprenylcysteine O-methyltransferase Ste14
MDMMRRLPYMLALVRSLVYLSLVIGLLVVSLPPQILYAAGIVPPGWIGTTQIVALEMLALGGALAVWSIVAFAFEGKGTPAPFDPPRKVVATGPYRWVRNPLYVGTALVLAGSALFFHSAALGALAAGFCMVAHLFVVYYEEPTMERTFGARYSDYANAVPRWLPRWRPDPPA